MVQDSSIEIWTDCGMLNAANADQHTGDNGIIETDNIFTVADYAKAMCDINIMAQRASK